MNDLNTVHTRLNRGGASLLGVLMTGSFLVILSQPARVSTPNSGVAAQETPVAAPVNAPILATSPSQTVQPSKAFPRRLFQIPVTVTGYSSTPGQTDSTPFITASNTRVRQGVLALSRDLLREFTPGAPFSYGDKVELGGVGVFVVEDTMNSRYTQRVDIWFSNRSAARRWGLQKHTLAKLSESAETQGLLAEADGTLFTAAFSD